MSAHDARPAEIQVRAYENLRFIRDTMERAGAFTAVPGRGTVLVGLTALAAAAIASRTSRPGAWITVWLVEAAAAAAIASVAIVAKARAARLAIWHAPARKTALGLLPPVLAGAVITASLAQAGRTDLLPSAWLLLYGAGVIAAGAYSVRIIPVMGAAFMAAGAAAALCPAGWRDAVLAAAFGGLHVAFGAAIWRRHGG